MPWTPAQHRLFEAAAHDPAIAKRKGIPQQQAATMASEGIKDPPAQPSAPPAPVSMKPKGPTGPVGPRPGPQALAAALMRMK